jgi:hypothetical protein
MGIALIVKEMPSVGVTGLSRKEPIFDKHHEGNLNFGPEITLQKHWNFV